nr:uncharacterized protein LOC126534081 isoform X2 [Dermacentor andersoni]
MAETQLVAVLLLVGFAEILTSDNLDIYQLLVDAPDIRKFVVTKVPLWTYNVTGRSHAQCKVDVMINETDTSIFFTRLFYYGAQKKKFSMVLEGQFNAIYPEHMLIQRNAPPIRWYELRVRNSSIIQGPDQGCEEEFDDLLTRQARVYQPYCQAILPYYPVRDTKSA